MLKKSGTTPRLYFLSLNQLTNNSVSTVHFRAARHNRVVFSPLNHYYRLKKMRFFFALIVHQQAITNGGTNTFPEKIFLESSKPTSKNYYFFVINKNL